MHATNSLAYGLSAHRLWVSRDRSLVTVDPITPGRARGTKSRRQPLSGLSNSQYFRDDVVDAHAGGVDENRIRGRLERRDSP